MHMYAISMIAAMALATGMNISSLDRLYKTGNNGHLHVHVVACS